MILLTIVGLLSLLPVLYVVVQSFNSAEVGEPFVFSLSGWSEAFSSPKTLDSIGYSFLLSIRIPIGIAIAFPIAWLLIRVQIPFHALIERALWFGFFLPILPMTMGWILLLDQNHGLLNELFKMLPFVDGPIFSINSVSGILWVHLSLSTIPVMVILLAPALRQMDGSIEEAGEMCGANLFTILRKISIPLVAPAILIAFIAGLIRSLEVFEVEQLLGTPAGIRVYATRIYDLIAFSPPLYAQALALSTLFLVILIAIAAVYQYTLQSFGGRATLTSKGARFQPRLRSWWAYVASAVILTYVALGIGLPLLMLVLGSLNRLFGFFFVPSPWTLVHWSEVFLDPSFGSAARNSIWLSLSSATIGVFLYAIVAWILARTTIWGRNFIALLVWLPWAIPGIVLGVALLSIFINTPGVSALYGTMVPLILAMIIKDMPLGVQMLRTAVNQVSVEFEQAAVMSGAEFTTIFFRITIPLLAPMMAAVFLLSFMATMRDVSVLILLSSPGTRTLSLLMYEYATTSRLESAAVLGVIMAVVSLAVATLVSRLSLKMAVE